MSTNASQISTVSLNIRRGVALSQSVPPLELAKAFGACQWWLSKPWLNDHLGNHPMQQLWRETGWASDVECFLIGSAIYKLHKHGTTSEAFEEKKREFLGDQAGNQRGYLFELLTALLFQEGGNQAKLLPTGSAGYDIDIVTPSGVEIQVSCKVVQPSELYKKFNDDAKKSRAMFTRACQQAGRQGISCLLQGTAFDNGVVGLDELLQVLACVTPNQAVQYNGNPWSIFASQNSVPSYALRFSGKFLSYSFVVGVPVNQQRERKRVLDKVNEANKKFKKYADQDKVSITAISVPTYLSLDTIEAAISGQFNVGRYKATSAVLALQTSISNTNNGQGPVVPHTAAKFIVNPTALTPIPHSALPLSLVQPLGTVSTSSSTLTINGYPVKNDWYMYMDSVEQAVVALGTSMTGSGIPGTRRAVEWEGTNNSIGMPFIPNEFRLL